MSKRAIPRELRGLMDHLSAGKKDEAPSVVANLGITGRNSLFSPRPRRSPKKKKKRQSTLSPFLKTASVNNSSNSPKKKRKSKNKINTPSDSTTNSKNKKLKSRHNISNPQTVKRARSRSPRLATPRASSSSSSSSSSGSKLVYKKFKTGDVVIAKEFGKVYLSTIVRKGNEENLYTISYTHFPGEFSDDVHAKKLSFYISEDHDSIITKPMAKKQKKTQAFEKFKKKQLVVAKVFGKMYLTTIIKKGSKPNTYDISYIHYPGDISVNIHAKKLILYVSKNHDSIISKPTAAQLKKMEERFEKQRQKELQAIEKQKEEKKARVTDIKAKAKKRKEAAKLKAAKLKAEEVAKDKAARLKAKKKALKEKNLAKEKAAKLRAKEKALKEKKVAKEKAMKLKAKEKAAKEKMAKLAKEKAAKLKAKEKASKEKLDKLNAAKDKSAKEKAAKEKKAVVAKKKKIQKQTPNMTTKASMYVYEDKFSSNNTSSVTRNLLAPPPSPTVLEKEKPPVVVELFSLENVKKMVYFDFDKLWKRDDEECTQFWPVSLYHGSITCLQPEGTLYELIKFRHLLNVLSNDDLIPQIEMQCLLFVRFLTTRKQRMAYALYNCIVDFYRKFPICKNKNAWCPNLHVLELLLKGCKSKDKFEAKKSTMLLEILAEQIDLEIHPQKDNDNDGNNRNANSMDGEPTEMYKVGNYVDVKWRKQPGENLPGGRAKIVNVNVAQSTVDVAYVLESRSEKNIHYQFLKLCTSMTGKRSSRFAKLKAKENLSNGSSSGSIQSRKRKQNVVNQYVSILDTWFGKNATNNQSTKRFEDVIGLMLDIWSGEKVVEDDIRNNMEKMIRNRNNQNETFIVIVNMLNIFIEKYEHIVQLVDKQKLKTLPGKNTISRMSMDVGLVINDGNLYQKKYRGW